MTAINNNKSFQGVCIWAKKIEFSSHFFFCRSAQWIVLTSDGNSPSTRAHVTIRCDKSRLILKSKSIHHVRSVRGKKPQLVHNNGKFVDLLQLFAPFFSSLHSLRFYFIRSEKFVDVLLVVLKMRCHLWPRIYFNYFFLAFFIHLSFRCRTTVVNIFFFHSIAFSLTFHPYACNFYKLLPSLIHPNNRKRSKCFISLTLIFSL